MTGPGHYREAENLLRDAAQNMELLPENRAMVISAAQVHATLALAGATATARGNADPFDWAAWREVAS